MDKLIEKIREYPLENLQEVAIDLYSKRDDDTDLIFGKVISVLEEKMEEKQFIQFCNQF